MRTIKFLEKFSIALVALWCLLIPTMCAIEYYVQPIAFSIVKPIMLGWIALAIVIMFIQGYVLQWLEDRHIRRERTKNRSIHLVRPIDQYTCCYCKGGIRGCEFAWDEYCTDGDCLAIK